MGNSYKEKTKSSYYNNLNKYFRINQDKNYNNRNNIYFSLLTKPFSNNNIHEQNLFNENADISWLTYLKRKLLFLSNSYNYIWAKNLHIFISKNKFPSQYKYISIFFYEEFQILSLPKLKHFQPVSHYSIQNSNISKQRKKKEKYLYEINNDSSGEEDLNELDRCSTNIKNVNVYKEIINNIYNNNEIKISNDILGSLASISFEEINSFLIENDPTVNYKVGKHKLKQYIDVFRKHLCHIDHPINIIVNKFNNEFNSIILKSISSCKNILDDSESFKKCEDIIHQLQEFILILQVVTKLFYSKYISYEVFQDEKDEFLNLISFLVFNTGTIYNNIYEIIQIKNEQKIKIFEKKLENFGEMGPEDLGVKDIFCLNDITKEYMNKYININTNIISESDKDKKIEKENNLNIKEICNNTLNHNKINNKTMPNSKEIKKYVINLVDSINNNKNYNNLNNDINNNPNELVLNINSEEKKTKINMSINLKISEDNSDKNIFLLNFGRRYSSINLKKEKKINEPYYEAIKTLKNIIKCKTPLEKLVIIASLSSFITDCIYNFWKPVEENIHLSMLNVEADELMKILIYIIYKSKMSKLFVHLDFIKYFTIKETLTTMIGYYYTLVEGAINFISETKYKHEFLSK